MARLKVLLTQEGINFTNCVFNTEEGIEGLGLQPFVSSCIYLIELLTYTILPITQFTHSNIHNLISHFTYAIISIAEPTIKDFYYCFVFSTCPSVSVQGKIS